MHTQYLRADCKNALMSKLCKSFNQVSLSSKHSFSSQFFWVTMQDFVLMTNIREQYMPVITAEWSAALEHNRQDSERSAPTKSVSKNDLTSLLATRKFSLLCNSKPLSNPRWMHILCFCSRQSGSCWLQSSYLIFANRFGQCRS